MSTLRIQVTGGLPAYGLSTELDGDVYDFSFRWNVRDNHYYMDIKRGGDVLLSGIKLVVSEDLLGIFNYKKATGELPPGTFRVFDNTGFDLDPDTETFGDSVYLLYDEAV